MKKIQVNESNTFMKLGQNMLFLYALFFPILS